MNILETVPYNRFYFLKYCGYAGFFKARKHFKGKLIREVHYTMLDLESRRSLDGRMYICENNVLLTVHKGGKEISLVELDSTDMLAEVENLSKEMSQDLLTKNPANVTQFNIVFSSPVSYVALNKTHILLFSISVEGKDAEMMRGSLMTIYLSQHHKERTKNTLALISSVVNGNKPETAKPLHGISSYAANLAFGLVLFTLFVVSIAFISALGIMLFLK